jgi:hemoglobin-like flavoprotein
MASKKILIQIQVGAKDANIAVAKVEKSLEGLSSAQVKVAQTTKKARAQSGLNNAILLETGRLASDASYGFTAIANNLSQVVTLMSSFIETNGSAIESFKELGRSLIGTGGFLIIVQLLISFGPRLLDMLTGTTQAVKDLKKSQEEAAQAAGQQIGKLQTLVSVLENVNKSYYEKQSALDEINREHKKLNIQIDEEGNLTDKSREAIKNYIPILEQKAKAQAIAALLQKKFGELIEAENSSLEDNTTFFGRLLNIFGTIATRGLKPLDDLRERADKNRAKSIADIQEQIQQLLAEFNLLDTTGFDPDEIGIVKAFKGIKDVVLDEDLFEGRTRLQIMAQEMLEGAGDSAVKGLSVLGRALTEQTKMIKKASTVLVGLGTLAGQQTGVGKGLAIAGTLISTYAAAQKAYESQFSLPLPDAPVRAAIAAAAAVVQGLAQVAAIRRIKTPSGGQGSQSGTQTVINAPDFNVVGASETSQLATSLAGVTGRPIQAFVVGKQVTSQQELDRNITNNARID